jgi:dTDP-4-dehydrorhamnose reductase
MNKILLLGANGQVGWELQRALAPISQLIICDRQAADLNDLENLQRLVASVRPQVMVNASAYTAVDKAESDVENARRINADAVGVLAHAAREANALLVHYSTDYVFDGSGTQPFDEDAPTAPLSVYGQTKLEGEQKIRESGCRHLIFRTSWVYATRGSNFAKTMLRLAKERDELKIVSDQFGAPTSAEMIADITASVIQRLRWEPALSERACGTYHLVASGETSWYRYAQFVIREAIALGAELRTNPERIVPIATHDHPLPAMRPANSRLANGKLKSVFDLELPDWEFHMKRMIKELVEQGIV